MVSLEPVLAVLRFVLPLGKLGYLPNRHQIQSVFRPAVQQLALLGFRLALQVVSPAVQMVHLSVHL